MTYNNTLLKNRKNGNMTKNDWVKARLKPTKTHNQILKKHVWHLIFMMEPSSLRCLILPCLSTSAGWRALSFWPIPICLKLS